jgi:hypothetical protein
MYLMSQGQIGGNLQPSRTMARDVSSTMCSISACGSTLAACVARTGLRRRDRGRHRPSPAVWLKLGDVMELASRVWATSTGLDSLLD